MKTLKFVKVLNSTIVDCDYGNVYQIANYNDIGEFGYVTIMQYDDGLYHAIRFLSLGRAEWNRSWACRHTTHFSRIQMKSILLPLRDTYKQIQYKIDAIDY